MRIENRRVVNRKEINKAIIEDNELGLILTDSNLNFIENIGFNDFRLLDFSLNGNILILISKDWYTSRNTNKTILEVYDIKNNKQLFSTKDFLAYRGLIDSTSNYFLLEFYNGLCAINLYNGEVLFRKNRIDRNLYNADLNIENNIIYMPTGKKTILTYNFNEQNLKEIKLEKTNKTSWVKFNNAQSQLLVSDKSNCLNCYDYDSLNKPIWTIDFSKFEIDNRIWTHKLLTTENNLGCVQGFKPASNQTGYAGGTLYIFDMKDGNILDYFDYSNIAAHLITDFQNDKIIIDNMKTLSLTKKIIEETPMTKLINQ